MNYRYYDLFADGILAREAEKKFEYFDPQARTWTPAWPDFLPFSAGHPAREITREEAENRINKNLFTFELLAKEFARQAHAGQVDKGGHDYFSGHLAAVAAKCCRDDLRAIAWLHDVLEDTDTTSEDLQKAGFSRHIIDTVQVLTHHENESYEQYIRRIKRNPSARMIKRADLESNMDLSRIPDPSPKDLQRLEKYKKALDMLTKPEVPELPAGLQKKLDHFEKEKKKEYPNL